MIKDKRVKFALLGVIAFAISFMAGRFSKPAEIIAEYKDKEVIVYKEKKEERKNVTTTKRKVTSPDSTTTEEETTTDRSITDTSSEGSSSRETSSKTTTTRTSGLHISALVLAQDAKINEYEFGIAVSKRVLGNISIGVIATEKSQIGLTVGLEF